MNHDNNPANLVAEALFYCVDAVVGLLEIAFWLKDQCNLWAYKTWPYWHWLTL